MNELHYIGFDVHKKSIQFCVKSADGAICQEGRIRATRPALAAWCAQQKVPWKGGMEATMFSGWIYDALKPHAVNLKMAHPAMLKAITTGKHASDRLDARKIADLVRMDWIPSVWVAPPEIREMRLQLRYRNLVVRQATQVKNRIACTLMEHGAEFTKKKLHQEKYFHELLEQLDEVPESVRNLLRRARGSLQMFTVTQKALLQLLETDPRLAARVQLLKSIRGVGVVMALTWALEIGDPQRFGSIGQALSYCGLVAAFQQSAEKVYRGHLSKKRNAHLQTMLIEVAHLAPRYHPELQRVYNEAKEKRHANAGTLAVARKLVAYLMAVDKSGKPFQMRTPEAAAAPGSPAGSQVASPPAPPIAKSQRVAQRSSPSRVRSAAPKDGAPRTAPVRCAASEPAMGGSGGKAKKLALRA